MIIRLYEVYKNPHKRHHFEYIQEHKERIELSLIPTVELEELFYEISGCSKLDTRLVESD